MYERGVRRTRADTVSIGLVCTSSLCLHILILFSKRDFYSSSPHSDYYFDSNLPESRHEHSVWAGGRAGVTHALTSQRDVTCYCVMQLRLSPHSSAYLSLSSSRSRSTSLCSCLTREILYLSDARLSPTGSSWSNSDTDVDADETRTSH